MNRQDYGSNVRAAASPPVARAPRVVRAAGSTPGIEPLHTVPSSQQSSPSLASWHVASGGNSSGRSTAMGTAELSGTGRRVMGSVNGSSSGGGGGGGSGSGNTSSNNPRTAPSTPPYIASAGSGGYGPKIRSSSPSRMAHQQQPAMSPTTLPPLSSAGSTPRVVRTSGLSRIASNASSVTSSTVSSAINNTASPQVRMSASHNQYQQYQQQQPPPPKVSTAHSIHLHSQPVKVQQRNGSVTANSAAYGPDSVISPLQTAPTVSVSNNTPRGMRARTPSPPAVPRVQQQQQQQHQAPPQLSYQQNQSGRASPALVATRSLQQYQQQQNAHLPPFASSVAVGGKVVRADTSGMPSNSASQLRKRADSISSLGSDAADRLYGPHVSSNHPELRRNGSISGSVRSGASTAASGTDIEPESDDDYDDDVESHDDSLKRRLQPVARAPITVKTSGILNTKRSNPLMLSPSNRSILSPIRTTLPTGGHQALRRQPSINSISSRCSLHLTSEDDDLGADLTDGQDSGRDLDSPRATAAGSSSLASHRAQRRLNSSNSALDNSPVVLEARVNRKMDDLVITNQSLLNINSGLESKVRKQQKIIDMLQRQISAMTAGNPEQFLAAAAAISAAGGTNDGADSDQNLSNASSAMSSLAVLAGLSSATSQVLDILRKPGGIADISEDELDSIDAQMNIQQQADQSYLRSMVSLQMMIENGTKAINYKHSTSGRVIANDASPDIDELGTEHVDDSDAPSSPPQLSQA